MSIVAFIIVFLWVAFCFHLSVRFIALMGKNLLVIVKEVAANDYALKRKLMQDIYSYF